MTKAECYFCGALDNLTPYHELWLCPGCNDESDMAGCDLCGRHQHIDETRKVESLRLCEDCAAAAAPSFDRLWHQQSQI